METVMLVSAENMMDHDGVTEWLERKNYDRLVVWSAFGEEVAYKVVAEKALDAKAASKSSIWEVLGDTPNVYILVENDINWVKVVGKLSVSQNLNHQFIHVDSEGIQAGRFG